MTGFDSKQRMAADKFIAVEERKVGERYAYVPKLHPSEWMDAQPAQELVECLDCGSHNVGIPATYDSLVDSVKAQPAQEPVAYVTGTSFGRFIVEPLNRAMVLPIGMALYSSPQENT